MTSTRNIIPAGIACLLLFPCTWAVSWTSPNGAIAMHVWLQIAVVTGLAFAAWRVNPWVSLFLVVVTLSHFFSTYQPQGYGLVLNKKHIFSPGTLNYFTIVLGVVWFCIVSMVFKRDQIRWLFDAMCLIALGNVAFLAMQSFGYDPINTYEPTRVIRCGLTNGDPNTCAALLVMCLPAFFNRKSKFSLFTVNWNWLIPLVLAGVCLTESRGGYIAFGVAMMFSAWFLPLTLKQKVVGTLAVGCFAAGCVLLVKSDLLKFSFMARFEMVELGWKHFWDHPLLGHGVGQWQTVMHKYFYLDRLTDTWHARAHNEYMQGVFEFGVGFAVVVLGYLGTVFRKVRKVAIRPLIALVIIMTLCVYHYTFHMVSTGLVAATWLAILNIEMKRV